MLKQAKNLFSTSQSLLFNVVNANFHANFTKRIENLHNLRINCYSNFYHKLHRAWLLKALHRKYLYASKKAADNGHSPKLCARRISRLFIDFAIDTGRFRH
ncbi:hypothetical protein KC734_11580 [candidate division KSB1 bacterium]|nr:hypothetical protein [candidate division KSB1 bacterium]